jgi:phosphoribulokinase
MMPQSVEDGFRVEPAREARDGEGAAPVSLPFVLGVVGDSGSGKSTICDGVRTLIGAENITDLKLDDYHRYTRAERAERGLTALNPQVHNLSLMQEHLQLLRRGRPIRNRSYDHSNGSFGPVRIIEPREVVLARGLLGFPVDELRAAYDLAVFLYPDPDLLFRWKLRRDVRSRGYAEAEVLKQIAQHLLDAKQFVLPQAERADLVVRYQVPEWDMPDSEVQTSLILRRAAAKALGDGSSFDAFGDEVRMEQDGEQIVLHLSRDLSMAKVEVWARDRFPDTFTAERVGVYLEDGGGTASRAHLALIETLIARLTQTMRRAASSADSSLRTGTNG